MFLVHHGILPFLHQMKFGLDPSPRIYEGYNQCISASRQSITRI